MKLSNIICRDDELHNILSIYLSFYTPFMQEFCIGNFWKPLIIVILPVEIEILRSSLLMKYFYECRNFGYGVTERGARTRRRAVAERGAPS